MRFTPTAFAGSSVGVSLQGIAIGAQSGSFTSGGIDYGFFEFQYSTSSLILEVSKGANVDILLVGGGSAGTGQTGGGGGGVNIVSTRLLRGIYDISVGRGGFSGSVATSTSLTGYNINYTADGAQGGKSGLPQDNVAGQSSPSCGGLYNTAGGGGGGASQTGSSAFCPPSNVPDGANGGQGLTYNFDGTASVYGSGGGGGSAFNPFAGGGAGGTNAGNGASYNQNAQSGSNGFGGGGGGERANSPGSGGNGGHGTLIIRYRIQ
jgi:hypothetical protein